MDDDAVDVVVLRPSRYAGHDARHFSDLEADEQSGNWCHSIGFKLSLRIVMTDYRLSC